MPYDEQPKRLMDDWATLDRRYGHIYAHLKADEYWQPESFADISFEPDTTASQKPTAHLKAFLNGKRK